MGVVIFLWEKMQAFLIIGFAKETAATASSLAKKLKAKLLNFTVTKIEDVRALNSFVGLTVSEPTAVLIENIDRATTEALNAFLKNLEEPQENLYYLLTARVEGAVLPTIASRCQIIRINREQKLENQIKEILRFLKMGRGEKLAYVDKLKKREETIAFLENFIYAGHELLHQAKKKHLLLAGYLKVASLTLTRIKANGNVNLQLTNFVVSLV